MQQRSGEAEYSLMPTTSAFRIPVAFCGALILRLVAAVPPPPPLLPPPLFTEEAPLALARSGTCTP